jgi:hypothetical protein
MLETLGYNGFPVESPSWSDTAHFPNHTFITYCAQKTRAFGTPPSHS